MSRYQRDVTCSCSATLWARTREKAANDFRAAIPVFRKYADAGDPRAASDLVEVLCDLATLVPPEEGLWYCDAAEQAIQKYDVPAEDDVRAFMWLTRGTVHGQLGQTDESFASLSRAKALYAELEPSIDRDEFRKHHATTRLNLVRMLIRRQDIDGALSEAERAVEIVRTLLRADRPTHLTLWLDALYLRGLARLGKAQAAPPADAVAPGEAAIADFTEVITETSRSVASGYLNHLELLHRSLNLRLSMHSRLGHQKEVLADAERLLAENDRHPGVLPKAQIDKLRTYVTQNRNGDGAGTNPGTKNGH